MTKSILTVGNLPKEAKRKTLMLNIQLHVKLCSIQKKLKEIFPKATLEDTLKMLILTSGLDDEGEK